MFSRGGPQQRQSNGVVSAKSEDTRSLPLKFFCPVLDRLNSTVNVIRAYREVPGINDLLVRKGVCIVSGVVGVKLPRVFPDVRRPEPRTRPKTRPRIKWNADDGHICPFYFFKAGQKGESRNACVSRSFRVIALANDVRFARHYCPLYSIPSASRQEWSLCR
jgi:hypothetical protein